MYIPICWFNSKLIYSSMICPSFLFFLMVDETFWNGSSVLSLSVPLCLVSNLFLGCPLLGCHSMLGRGRRRFFVLISLRCRFAVLRIHSLRAHACAVRDCIRWRHLAAPWRSAGIVIRIGIRRVWLYLMGAGLPKPALWQGAWRQRCPMQWVHRSVLSLISSFGVMSLSTCMLDGYTCLF